jgi:hypothetical protein
MPPSETPEIIHKFLKYMMKFWALRCNWKRPDAAKFGLGVWGSEVRILSSRPTILMTWPALIPPVRGTFSSMARWWCSSLKEKCIPQQQGASKISGRGRRIRKAR